MSPVKTNLPYNNNPHASAAGAYGTNAQKHSVDPRELEARVLLKSAQFLQDMQKDWDSLTPEAMEETLKYNRNIWMMFYDTAVNDETSERPGDLRNNIIRLANFVFKRELDIMSNPAKEKLDILISINRDIAAGLMEGVSNDAAAGKTSGTASSSDIKNPPSGGTDRSA
jgi:flagellar protein FlaF